MTDTFTDKIDDHKNPGLNIPTYGFGQVRTSFFAYITPLMTLIFLAVIALIIESFDRLYMFFETNMALNGLIIGLMLIGVLGAFSNNLALFKIARFLKKMETARADAQVTHAQVLAFQKAMPRQAAILDTQNMFNAIGNLESFGHYNFTDMDARLIKSKVGFRISKKKESVGFLAGILVMLGLLGTFLGLLETIDAVGSAMANMATLDVKADGAMSEFIASLSAPLQGMGLAFSSSLFGLSGSLLIGFFNYLSGGAQNNFIENFSRWIDNRIPRQVSIDGKGGKGGHGGSATVPSALSFDQELKDWLSGYVALSVETNKQLKALAQTLNETLDGFGRGESLLEQISNKQDVQIKHAVTTNTNLSSHETLMQRSNETLFAINTQTTAHISDMHTKLYPSLDIFQDHLLTLLGLMKEHTNSLNDGLAGIEQTLQMTHYQSQDNLDGLYERLMEMTTTSEHAYTTIAERISHLHTTLAHMDDNQTTLATMPGLVTEQLQTIATILHDTDSHQKNMFTLFKEVNGSSGPFAKLLFKMEKSMLEMNKKVFDIELASHKFIATVVDKDT